jgi:hypothetical protein
MTSDAVARSIARVDTWVRLYTRGLPREVAEDRRDEVLADLRDQVAWAREHGIPAPRVARSLLGRALRGAPADLSWATSIEAPGRGLDRALLALLATLALLLIAVGGVALARRPTELLAPEALPVACGILLGVGALALLMRRRTRWLSGLWVVASAHVVLFDGVDYLAGSTTILRFVADAAPEWRAGMLVADAGVVLLGVAAAVWWARPVGDVAGVRG